MHCGGVPFGKIVVQRLVGQEDQRKKQGARRDRSKRLLGTLGLRLLWRDEGVRRRDSCATEMSMERGEGVSDFCLEAA